MKAVLYTRISQTEQSNFSLQGQKEIIKQYAQKNGFEIVAHFKDDGASGRDFKRPGWLQLEKYLKNNWRQLGAVLVLKYDRLCRNVVEGLSLIERYERKYNIKIVSVMESIGINPHSPAFFKFRADLLVNAEFERRVISDRSKFGMYHARLSGRYLGHAPWGYKNGRDSKNRPILLPNKERLLVVKEMIRMAIEGLPLYEIGKMAKSMGYPRGANGAVKRTITNPTYFGLVLVPGYQGEADKYVKGIHYAPCSQGHFYRVQDIFVKSPGIKNYNSKDFPLRGVLLCENGHLLTGAFSSGRSKKYPYYRCFKCGSYNADRAHDNLQNILSEISLPMAYLHKVKKRVKKLVADYDKRLEYDKKDFVKLMDTLKKKIDRIEEKFINDEITQSTYKKWGNKYRAELSSLKDEIIKTSKGTKIYGDLISKHLDSLGNLAGVYNKADVQRKKRLVNLLFPDGLHINKGGYRTNYISFPVSSNCLNSNLLEITDPDKNIDLNSFFLISTRNEYEIEPLLNLLKLVS